MLGDFGTVLRLVGTLDDAAGDDTPRSRFRGYLGTGLTDVGLVRDAVQICIANSGPQYARALQDLVNYLGSLLGFEVEYGRYQGVQGQIGHDGLWRSSHHVVVVEAKTTDAYTINTATLPNYINSLRSAGRITSDDQVIGLYVYAKVDAHVKQLEHGIIAEKRTQELRVASVGAILSLAELFRQDVIAHDEALEILWPSGVWVDTTVDLLQRISATTSQPPPAGMTGQPPAAGPAVASPASPTAAASGRPSSAPTSPDGRAYYLAPVADNPTETARETLGRLLPAKVWAFSKGTPHRAKLSPGDMIAFYQASVGVVATAEVATSPEEKPLPIVKNSEKYAWTFSLRNVSLFQDSPVVIDAALRSRLDEFADRDPNTIWSWFVFAFRLVTEHDFRVLTGTDQAQEYQSRLLP